MSDNSKEPVTQLGGIDRFSDEESIASYNTFYYNFTPEEVIINGGILSISSICCLRGKLPCDCLNKTKNWLLDC